MFYYEIAPADRNYRGENLLTYCHDQKQNIGQVVVVKLRAKSIKGFVVNEVKKPTFKVKDIERIYSEILVPELQVLFFRQINSYYPGSLGATASLFVPNLNDKVKIPEDLKEKNVVKKYNNRHKPTSQQKQIISAISHSKVQTHIVHGDTGTGKTLIYLSLINEMNKENKSSILLTPEISLTPQIAEQVNDSFDNVYVIHSALSVKEKRDIWLQINSSKKPAIVIGPRSALFAPVKNLGMVIVDEFHDSAYKQDQNPKYQTVRIAGILSKICGSKLVLGSATPPVDDYFYAEKVGAEIHRLDERPFNYSGLNDLVFVKINNQNEKSGHDLITKTAISEIQKALENHQQVLVFHNKRGTSRTILCENCGWIEVCERCNIPYIYHHDKNTLVCHSCNINKHPSINCQKCGSASILFRNPGTKAIEESLKKLFPSAKIGRYDKDNNKLETFYSNYQDIKDGKVDILVGTQLLTKGHDLPNLSLVVVLLANSALQFPDFSAEEKNYQQLHQVMGRVGRGISKGRVIIQDFENKTLESKTAEQKIGTWQDFYSSELKNRQKYTYPPFCFLLKLNVIRASQKSAIKTCEDLVESITKRFSGIEVIGPSPALNEKKNNQWNWQIIIKSTSRSKLTDIVRVMPRNISHDLDPSNLL